MKKRIFSTLFILGIMGIAIFNVYFDIQYDMNLVEYFSNSGELTQEEKLWLEKKGKIIYGLDQNSPPLRYLDDKDGQYRGLVVDYIRALSIELQTEISFESVRNWGDAIAGVKNEEKDFFDLIASTERKKNFNFSDPIYSLRGTILIPEDNTEIVDYKDLKGKKVAMPKLDYAEEFLSDKVTDVQYVFTAGMQEAMMLMKEGKVDAVVGDEPIITYLKDELDMKDKFKTIDGAMYEKECVLATPKNEKMLVSILNKGIYRLKRKNVMENIQVKWFGISDSFAKEDKSRKTFLFLLYSVAIMGAVTYFVFLWNNRLKREVQKRTKELQLNRNNLQITIDGLTQLMIVINSDYRIIDVNKAFSSYVGYEHDEIIGEDIRRFKGLVTSFEVAELIRSGLKNDETNKSEIEYENGIFQVSVRPLSNDEEDIDNLPKVLLMIKDVTKVKIAEGQILQNNKMMAVGQLAAGVAHEIRNPLGVIRNYCYILKRNIDKDIEKQKKSIDVIESSVERASGIIDNLLNFSRISSNVKKDIKMKEFILNILKLEGKLFKKRDVEYKIICEDDFVWRASEESLKHILLNLISNAVDAMESGGNIEITCREIQKKMILICKDTGTGIDSDNLEKIYDPFFSTKVTGKGTGLGLYIVYNEVNKNNGTINVESIKGEGTTFKILLPYGDDEDVKNH